MKSISFHMPVLESSGLNGEIIDCLNDLVDNGVRDVKVFFDTLVLHNDKFKGGCFHASEIRYEKNPVVFTNAKRCLEITKRPIPLKPYFLFTEGQNIKDLISVYGRTDVLVLVQEKDLVEHKRVSGDLSSPIVLEQLNFRTLREAIK